MDLRGRPVLGLDQEQAADVQESDEGRDKNPEEPHEPEWQPPYWDSMREALEELDDVKALDGDQRAAEKCEADAQGMSPAEKACSIPGLRWREHISVEPMRRKTPASAEQALNKVITEAHEMGFPVVRLHSDSGSEFVSSHVRRLVTKFGMKQTCSAPEEHNSNGRIENVVRRIKNQVRVHLQSKGYDASVWPLAARAAAATWRTQVLRGMGFPAAPDCAVWNICPSSCSHVASSIRGTKCSRGRCSGPVVHPVLSWGPGYDFPRLLDDHWGCDDHLACRQVLRSAISSAASSAGAREQAEEMQVQKGDQQYRVQRGSPYQASSPRILR